MFDFLVLIGGALMFGVVITVFALVMDWREKKSEKQA